MLVRTNQCESGTVEISDGSFVRFDNGERDTAITGAFDSRFYLGLVRTRSYDQCKGQTKKVIKRTAVGKPGMGRQIARTRVLSV